MEPHRQCRVQSVAQADDLCFGIICKRHTSRKRISKTVRLRKPEFAPATPLFRFTGYHPGRHSNHLYPFP